MTQELWFSDSEVFKYDTLWCFKRQRDGETVAIWNDPDEVRDFINMVDPVLCGFNFRDYDSHILKATLLGWSAEEIHHVSRTIVENDDRSLVWALFNGHKWVNLPPIIDLYHDIVPRRSLKVIEANIGMSIMESSVSFDIDRPLTRNEQDEVQEYCLHDISATKRLYDLRYDYVKAKSDLCELRGVDPLTMLKHTNARIVSEVLNAQKLEHPHNADEFYEVPDNVDLSAIPASVLQFATSIHGYNCEDDFPDIEFMFHGCPTKVGLGGIHAAVPSYKETASDERAILIQDIGSYYPSLIINNGYMSRAVSDHSAYQQFYDLRMKAKADGDKATAEAAKLVLNTTFGTMKDGYNKMYDPMMNTRVCLSGQLYILDLIEQMFRAVPEGLQLIQLNTDGWVISITRDELDTINEVVSRWSERTRFTVDTDEVEVIVQANVNNYAMRFADGKMKVKGGVVAKYAGGDFKSNSATIIDKAVVNYLLDGKPVEFTIEECDDIERFQIVAKAGQTFQKVVCTEWNDQYDMPEEVETQRCNRVYATTERECGGIFKLKLDENGKEVGRSKIPLTPEHCHVDNENIWKGTPIHLTTLDKGWYVALAKKKAKAFVTRDKKERELMAETDESHNEQQTQEAEGEAKPTPKRRSSKKAEEPTVVPFKEKLLTLQKEMAEAAKGVKFDGVIDNINYEYADTQQYKAWLAALASRNRLIIGLDLSVDFLGIIGKSKNGGDIYAAQADGEVTFTDADSDDHVHYAISGFGSNVQPGYCNGGAQTNAIRNFILNGFMLDNKGREGDDQAFNAATDAASNSYTSPDAKAAIKQNIKEEKAEEKQYATDLFAKALYELVMDARKVAGHETFGDKMLAEHFKADGTAKLHTVGDKMKSTMLKDDAVKGVTRAEEIIAEGAKTGEAA